MPLIRFPLDWVKTLVLTELSLYKPPRFGGNLCIYEDVKPDQLEYWNSLNIYDQWRLVEESRATRIHLLDLIDRKKLILRASELQTIRR